MAVKEFFKTTWVFFIATGVIVACSVLLYFVMDKALRSDNAGITYIEAETQAPVLDVGEEDDQQSEPENGLLNVLPQYELRPVDGVGSEYGWKEYDSMYTPAGAISVLQAGDIAVRYVMLLVGEEMDGAECEIHLEEGNGYYPDEQYWDAQIIPADRTFGVNIWLSAYSGQLLQFARYDNGVASEIKQVNVAGDYEEVLTQYEFAQAVKDCVKLSKEILEDHLLGGRKISDVQPLLGNAYEYRQTVGGGNLIAHDFVLDDGYGYRIAFIVKSEETPELFFIVAFSQEAPLMEIAREVMPGD